MSSTWVARAEMEVKQTLDPRWLAYSCSILLEGSSRAAQLSFSRAEAIVFK
jgi:hypothetical protein